ncbi:unnamed protein product [Anisakis simplex]|uniref:Transporter n=1 Tax=Anisakis simplex TaxID=6269 RepID=A0A0M3J2L9_ANISI|nr:unnamed protein product [Anisakis simplex]
MWFEERSWSNLKMSSLLVEEWRDLWSLKIDVIVASLAYVFATTNFLNLPKLILENGGLAFVAAYAAAILACVLPIIVMELSVGQLTGRAPVQALYNMCPIFRGVGISQIIFSLFVMAHMARFLGWLMLYLFHLFWAVLDGRPALIGVNFSTLEQPSHSIVEVGDFQIYLLAAMGAVWVLVFIAICFGVRWLGKVLSSIIISFIVTDHFS